MAKLLTITLVEFHFVLSKEDIFIFLVGYGEVKGQAAGKSGG